MKVCYFGTYDPSFVRNATIMKGLRQNGVEVVQCNRRAWASTDEKMLAVRGGFAGIRSLLRLIVCYVQLLAAYFFMEKHDLIIVGYPGHLDVFVAKLLSVMTRRPLVFDAFLSLYETAVEDRKLISKKSIKARLMLIVDRYSCHISDLVLLDTCSHVQYFVEQFDLPAGKFRRVFATADDDDYRPAGGERASDAFNVIYFGQFIPLHGIEHVIEAAAILASHEHIRFSLYGTGQTIKEMMAKAQALKLKNVEFVEAWLSPSDLSKVIDGCDLCLGTFGGSGKALRVIPNKVFVGLAKAKPVLSGDTPAMREVFEPGDTLFLCSPCNPASIAESILAIDGNSELRCRVAGSGLSLYEKTFRPVALGFGLTLTLAGVCADKEGKLARRGGGH